MEEGARRPGGGGAEQRRLHGAGEPPHQLRELGPAVARRRVQDGRRAVRRGKCEAATPRSQARGAQYRRVYCLLEPEDTDVNTCAVRGSVFKDLQIKGVTQIPVEEASSGEDPI